MSKTYEVTADSDGREITWETPNKLEAVGWYGRMKRTRMTIDTQRPVFAAQLKCDGRIMSSFSD